MFHYLLDDEGNPVLTTNTIEWARGIDADERRFVGKTTFFGTKTTVRTIFLGMSYLDPPIDLFELAVINPQKEDLITRCATWEEAVQSHQEIVRSLADKYRIKTNVVRESPRIDRKSIWDRLSQD